MKDNTKSYFYDSNLMKLKLSGIQIVFELILPCKEMVDWLED